MKYIKFLLILLLMPNLQSFAQSSDQETFVGIEEIIVTARKREEPLQETPVTITALTDAKIQKLYATDLKDLGMSVPNLIINTSASGSFTNSAAVFMRGIGNSDIDSTIDPPIGIFLDGVYVPRSSNSNLDLFDVEQVEVLRGPQGTLFGRNTTAGAIVVRSKRPTGEFGAKARLTLGEYGRRDLRVAVESPLTDKINAKISVLQQKSDGFYKARYQTHPNYSVPAQMGYDYPGDYEDTGGDDLISIRPMLEFNPSDNFKLTLIGEYSKDRSEPIPAINASKPNQVLSRVYGRPGQGYQRNVTLNFGPGFINADIKGLTAEAIWELEGGTLTSITNYRETEYQMREEIDWTDAPMFGIVRTEPHEQKSTELRYSTDINDRLSLTAGIYYFEQEYLLRRDTYINTSGAFLAHIIGITTQSHEQQSVFADLTYAINDRLNISFGGRYTKEEKSYMQKPFSVANNATEIYKDDDWSNFGPKVGIDYQIDEDKMLYATLARGFKSGGFNGRGGTPTTLGPFDEESVDALEIGLKADWGPSLRTNIAFYLMRFEDLQRTVIRPLINCGCPNPQETVTANAAEAEIKGIEIEIEYVPNDNFNLSMALAFNDAGYEEYFADVFGSGAQDYSGLPLQNAPDITAAINMSYSIDMANDASTVLNLGWQYHDDLNASVTGYGPAEVDARGVLNASIDYIPAEGNWRISAYGKNLGDDIDKLSTTNVSVLLDLAYYSNPRVLGIELAWEY
ncbi:MAG: TonB-dependent receptor [Pseudomonadota bacterium]|nr:TonB-dependent receptor [Pseudomonadota bacterium]